jgi:hypothetical protein
MTLAMTMMNVEHITGGQRDPETVHRDGRQLRQRPTYLGSILLNSNSAGNFFPPQNTTYLNLQSNQKYLNIKHNNLGFQGILKLFV